MPDQTKKAAKKSLTRRQILKTTALAGGAMAAPYIVPSHVLGKGGATPPSEKIVLGGIGIGPRGTHDLKQMLPKKEVQFVAICDAQKSRREAVKKLVDENYGNTDCKLYSDMREFLASRKDIDALLIATGDRWHAPAAIMAMRAGKDVYSEKPSCMTIAQGQAVVDAAKKHGRIYQTGTQRLSEANFVFCIEMARLGRLGALQAARAHIAPWDKADMTHDWLPPEPCPPKDEVDWDEWLGSCPFRPYNSSYVRGGWRGHYDFHTSCIGEWGAHTFAQSQAGLNKLDTSPTEYEYVKNETGDGMVTTFPEGLKLILAREGWKGSCGMKFEGSDGWVACADGYKQPDVSDPAMLKDFDKIIKDYSERTGRVLTGLPGGDGVVYHSQDFFDCVRSRKPTVANAEVMFHSMSTVHAANICMWLRKSQKYDPATKTFADPEANGFVTRPMREPWVI
jgi:hypothetical protein